jgi:ATP-dependent RNA helicase DeaD
LGDGYDRFRGVVEPLTDEFDLVEIALAAVSLIEGAGGQDADQVELSSPPLVVGPPMRTGRPAPIRANRGAPIPRPGGLPSGNAGHAGPAGPWVRLFVGGGRRVGLRPGDLVGAITNEAHVPGNAVGAIQINEGFSLVDVQEGVADAVIGALREATIRGRRLQVRRDA